MNDFDKQLDKILLKHRTEAIQISRGESNGLDIERSADKAKQAIKALIPEQKYVEKILNSIDAEVSVTIERLKDENGKLFYRVTDKSDSVRGYWYEGRGYALTIALKDFIDDLRLCENKTKYDSYGDK